jgi:hypothetical protein
MSKGEKYCKKCPEDELEVVRQNPRTTVCPICGKIVIEYGKEMNKCQ